MNTTAYRVTKSFSTLEVISLLDMVLKNIKTIENKSNDPTVLKEKEKAWKKITEVYNSLISFKRETKELKLKYNKIRYRLKKKLLNRTDPTTIMVTEHEQRLLQGLLRLGQLGLITGTSYSNQPGDIKRKRSQSTSEEPASKIKDGVQNDGEGSDEHMETHLEPSNDGTRGEPIESNETRQSTPDNDDIFVDSDSSYEDSSDGSFCDLVEFHFRLPIEIQEGATQNCEGNDRSPDAIPGTSRDVHFDSRFDMPGSSRDVQFDSHFALPVISRDEPFDPRFSRPGTSRDGEFDPRFGRPGTSRDVQFDSRFAMPGTSRDVQFDSHLAIAGTSRDSHLAIPGTSRDVQFHSCLSVPGTSRDVQFDSHLAIPGTSKDDSYLAIPGTSRDVQFHSRLSVPGTSRDGHFDSRLAVPGTSRDAQFEDRDEGWQTIVDPTKRRLNPLPYCSRVVPRTQTVIIESIRTIEESEEPKHAVHSNVDNIASRLRAARLENEMRRGMRN
ncbi:uncharacterized protein LOC126264574 [Aethina tumida]|uniref:uncharacterized protein LOC126264574 n=1 Tax=Aethina tumida TaxID=116153 RepID=UPI0021479465|nr:uncharacterized protein LOC126264574 [Aethina tumida]